MNAKQVFSILVTIFFIASMFSMYGSAQSSKILLTVKICGSRTEFYNTPISITDNMTIREMLNTNGMDINESCFIAGTMFCNGDNLCMNGKNNTVQVFLNGKTVDYNATLKNKDNVLIEYG